MEYGPLAMGLIVPPYFLAMGISLAPNEVWSEVLWDELVVGSYPLA